MLEERTGDLQRQLLLAQSELKAAREDAHIHELDKSQLQAQLAGKFDQLLQTRCCTVSKGLRYMTQQDISRASDAPSDVAVEHPGNDLFPVCTFSFTSFLYEYPHSTGGSKVGLEVHECFQANCRLLNFISPFFHLAKSLSSLTNMFADKLHMQCRCRSPRHSDSIPSSL